MIWWWFFILCTMWWIICMTLSTGPPTCPPSTPASPSPSLLPSSSFSRWAEHPTSSSLLLWLPSSSTFQRCSRRQAADRREQTRCHSRTNYDLNCEETRQLDQLWRNQTTGWCEEVGAPQLTNYDLWCPMSCLAKLTKNKKDSLLLWVNFGLMLCWVFLLKMDNVWKFSKEHTRIHWSLHHVWGITITKFTHYELWPKMFYVDKAKTRMK